MIQIGDTYYVRDGHHRVSVALALGQTDIEAQVMVWAYPQPLAERQSDSDGASAVPLAA